MKHHSALTQDFVIFDIYLGTIYEVSVFCLFPFGLLYAGSEETKLSFFAYT